MDERETPSNSGLIGTRLGRLRLDSVIGRGGFATVYRAYDEGLDADVAVKVLADNHSLDPEVRERFLAEGRLLRRVQHPSIVSVFDVGETPMSQPFLVLQLATGGTLADRMSGGTAATRADLEALIKTLSEGLDSLHQAHIVHRDLSPDNVFIAGHPTGPSGGLLSPGERFLLGDLGLAKDLAASSGLTANAGTRGFAAPEQLDAAGIVGPQADVYGATMLVRCIAEGTKFASSVEACTAPAALEDAEQRTPTIVEWANLFDTFDQADETSPTTKTQPQARLLPRPPRRRRFRFAPLVLLTGFAITGLLTISLVLSNLRRAPSAEQARSVAIYSTGVLDPAWHDQSWSFAESFEASSGTIALEPFGALSFHWVEPARQSTGTVLLVDVTLSHPVALQANNLDGERLPDRCVLSESVTGYVGLERLGVGDGQLSRVSLVNIGDEAIEITLSELAIVPPVAAVGLVALRCG